MAQNFQSPGRLQLEQLSKRKADQLGLPYVNLVSYPIKPSILQIIPQELAEKYQAVAYFLVRNKVRIATVDPTNKRMIQEIGDLLADQGFEPNYSVASAASLEYALKSYSMIQKTLSSELELGEIKESKIEQEIQTLSDLKKKITQVSITELFHVLLAGAAKTGSSDIHVEPTEKGMRIRYRIDGVLQEVAKLDQKTYKGLVSRIKYLAHMKMDLVSLPQDGRFNVRAAEKEIDLRVSTLPTIYGENIVMRLLEQTGKFLTLQDLGFNAETIKKVEYTSSKPQGMILNTGPTGSGKTTTLYAVLDRLNRPGVKIITLEDPVEYHIEGISQSQISASSDYNFAKGLRAVVRQDPDIILVGEIRDSETAQIAVHASMTGHLLLSTMHTNDATAALIRLLDLGVEAYLLPGLVNLILGQRLVRKICPVCKKELKPDDKILAEFEHIMHKRIEVKKLWKGKGCDVCNNTGYKGRTPIVEALVPSVEIERLVVGKKPFREIKAQVIKEGMTTMEQDGVRKVIEGITTIEEVWRVAKE